MPVTVAIPETLLSLAITDNFLSHYSGRRQLRILSMPFAALKLLRPAAGSHLNVLVKKHGSTELQICFSYLDNSALISLASFVTLCLLGIQNTILGSGSWVPHAVWGRGGWGRLGGGPLPGSRRVKKPGLQAAWKPLSISLEGALVSELGSRGLPGFKTRGEVCFEV